MAGKPSAQKQLYDQFSKEMFRVCLVYACNYDTANDLLQEGFLKVFQKLHKYNNSGSLGGWIRTVITNSCIDHYRSDKWEKKKLVIDEDYVMDNLLVTFNEVESRFENADFLNIIKDLPEGYRVVLNLYFLEGYKHHEIASKLNITEGTSKSQLFKAKKYLKAVLEETMTEEELKEYGGFIKKVV
ncbi:MAG: sigma-70 family RNA polymerase sigma factor [Brumimicrobium sp.]